MGRAHMIGGVFLLSRDPGELADWYHRNLGWELDYLADDDTHYAELYFREDARPEERQHLVYAIMPGDPGEPGSGHIVNYRVDDLDSIVTSVREGGIETSPIRVGPDAEGQGKFVRFQDPEGHRIELWEHLGREP